MRRAQGWRMGWTAALLVAMGAWQAVAQQPEEASGEPNEVQATQEAAPAAPAAPDQAAQDEAVMRELMQQRQAPPVVEPSREPGVRPVPSRIGAPATRVDIDPAILGVAPGQEAPELRREGEFVVSRRGRLVRSPDGAHVLYVFEADDKASPEPPMILQACQLLETMENIVQQRGDQVEFIVSGQIHTYRGANYLLPTMMKIAVDHGNLQP